MSDEITISADEFFVAVIAALRLNGQVAVDINTDLDRAFEQIYRELKERATKEHIFLPFRIKSDPVYGDSEYLRELIDTGSKNNVIDVANPSFKRMRPKLSDEQANFFLSRFPVDTEWFAQVVVSQFDVDAQRALPGNAT